jgi:hypothetical protein
MIYAVILDKKDNYSSWGNLSNEEVTISLKSDMNDLPYCDAIIISDSFNERPIEENLAEIKKMAGFKCIPCAAAVCEHSIERQEYLIENGFDDVIQMPLCRELIVRRIEGLAAILPYSLSSGKFSYESLLDIRDNGESGAYSVQSNDFTTIYRFIIRILKRLDKSAQVLLMKLTCNEADSEEKKPLIMQILANGVRACLRRGDIASVCGEDQVVVLLIGADDDGGHLVANRIVSSFYSECDDGSFTLEYDIHEVKPGRK